MKIKEIINVNSMNLNQLFRNNKSYTVNTDILGV